MAPPKSPHDELPLVLDEILSFGSCPLVTNGKPPWNTPPRSSERRNVPPGWPIHGLSPPDDVAEVLAAVDAQVRRHRGQLDAVELVVEDVLAHVGAEADHPIVFVVRRS